MDTNVLFSILLFPRPRMNAMMQIILTKHKLILSSFILNELQDIVQQKFPSKKGAVDQLLLKMSYDLVYTPENMNKTLFSIRDSKDYPVLYTAIIENVDVLITGDKDFADIEIERPEILTPADFLSKYIDWKDLEEEYNQLGK